MQTAHQQPDGNLQGSTEMSHKSVGAKINLYQSDVNLKVMYEKIDS